MSDTASKVDPARKAAMAFKQACRKEAAGDDAAAESWLAKTAEAENAVIAADPRAKIALVTD